MEDDVFLLVMEIFSSPQVRAPRYTNFRKS